MELSLLKPGIQKKVSTAFESFGLSAPHCDVTTENAYNFLPDKKVCRWAGGPNCVHLHQDIQSNPYLTELAAHCIAASTKNNYLNKGLFLWCASFCGSIMASTIPLCFAIDSIPSYGSLSRTSTFLILGKFLAAFIPIYFAATNDTYYTMIGDSISDYFDGKSFSLACQKFIEQKNLKPLATYYAFAKLVKHRPLSQKSQISTIKWWLHNNELSITSSLTSTHSARASIWKDGTCIMSADYCEPLRYQEVNLASDNTSARLRLPFIYS
jgi:hypothetical protein